MNMSEVLAEIWPKLELYIKKLLATFAELFGFAA